MTTPTIIGLDIAKSSFQVHGVAASGRPTLRKKLRRGQVLEFFANLPPCVIGMEACGGAHHWARELTKLGHEVRLMPAQYVKPYVKTNKHDAADAEGCCEAVQRPSMRFVPVKSETQQALLMLHRIRDRLVAERTGTISAVRGHMAEFGIVAARRGPGMKELLAIISDLDDARLPPLARELLVLQVEHLRAIETRIAALDERLQHQARSDEAARRLTAIPGVGPVIATAMVATVVDARRRPARGSRERLTYHGARIEAAAGSAASSGLATCATWFDISSFRKVNMRGRCSGASVAPIRHAPVTTNARATAAMNQNTALIPATSISHQPAIGPRQEAMPEIRISCPLTATTRSGPTRSLAWATQTG